MFTTIWWPIFTWAFCLYVYIIDPLFVNKRKKRWRQKLKLAREIIYLYDPQPEFENHWKVHQQWHFMDGAVVFFKKIPKAVFIDGETIVKLSWFADPFCHYQFKKLRRAFKEIELRYNGRPKYYAEIWQQELEEKFKKLAPDAVIVIRL